MFDVNIPNGENYRESTTFAPGRTAYVRLAVGRAWRCNLLRHPLPEQYKALAKAGAKFLPRLRPSPRPRAKSMWHILLRARAIENGCFVFAAAQGGRHANGRTTYGRSLIVSPWGDILGEGGTEPEIIMADINSADVDRVRARIPALDHTCDFAVTVLPKPKLAALEVLE